MKKRLLFSLLFFFYPTLLIAANNCPVPENIKNSMCSGTFIANTLAELETYKTARVTNEEE